MNENAYMKRALELAQKAGEMNEIPVGAVIVYNGEIIGEGYNTRVNSEKTCSHAELMAMEQANEYIGSWRLEDCDMYVTLEPCSMCAGAIMQARMRKVYFGAYDKKAGALGSLYNMYDVQGFNHYPEIEGGIMEEQCSEILTTFFKKLRNKGQ